MTRTALRRVALAAGGFFIVVVIIAAIAGGGGGGDEDDSTPAPVAASTPSATEQVIEQPAQQEAQAIQYVGSVSQDGDGFVLPLSASDKTTFCDSLLRAAFLSAARAALWDAGQPADVQRSNQRRQSSATREASREAREFYYETNPPIDNVFLQLSELFETLATGYDDAVTLADLTEIADRQLASTVSDAWEIVADYCGS